MSARKPTVGILAFGSLLKDPGEEIREVMTGIKTGVETPFPVEFARASKERGGAPTLVPVARGQPVQGRILLLDTSAEDAIDRLYRREINKVGGTQRYRPPPNPGPKNVLIKRLESFSDIDVVLYAELAANIEDLSPANLARLAIESARRLDDRRDGISYLIDAKEHGIRTALSDAYEDEIKRQLGPQDLVEALRIVRGG
jgi:hypothetical protein